MNIDQQALARVYAAGFNSYVTLYAAGSHPHETSAAKCGQLAVRDFVSLMYTLQAEEDAKAQAATIQPYSPYTSDGKFVP
jgi:hypothetical protein